MNFVLKKEHANRLVSIENSKVVVVPADEFGTGDVLMFFNNSDEFISLRSEIPYSYKSSHPKSYQFFEVPPRALMNVIFIKDDLMVVTRGMT